MSPEFEALVADLRSYFHDGRGSVAEILAKHDPQPQSYRVVVRAGPAAGKEGHATREPGTNRGHLHPTTIRQRHRLVRGQLRHRGPGVPMTVDGSSRDVWRPALAEALAERDKALVERDKALAEWDALLDDLEDLFDGLSGEHQFRQDTVVEWLTDKLRQYGRDPERQP
jgi:hypothetical protein